MCFCLKFTSYFIYLYNIYSGFHHLIFQLPQTSLLWQWQIQHCLIQNITETSIFSEFSHQAYYPSFCIPSLIPCFCSSKIYIFFFLNKSATDMQGIQVDMKLHREFSYLRCFKHNILKSANQQLQLNLSNNTVETISRDHWHWYCASFLTWNGSKYQQIS